MDAETWCIFLAGPVKALFSLIKLGIGLYLLIIPGLIYNELKRQGAARADEAMRITSLLATLASTLSQPTTDNHAAHLQTLADLKAQDTDND